MDRLISKRIAIEGIQPALDAMLTGTEDRAVIVFDRLGTRKTGVDIAPKMMHLDRTLV